MTGPPQRITQQLRALLSWIQAGNHGPYTAVQVAQASGRPLTTTIGHLNRLGAAGVLTTRWRKRRPKVRSVLEYTLAPDGAHRAALLLGDAVRTQDAA